MEYTYKLIPPFGDATESTSVRRSDGWAIPFDPANTDYQKFKTDVLGGDTLENVDGVAMTQEEADAFIATLP